MQLSSREKRAWTQVIATRAAEAGRTLLAQLQTELVTTADSMPNGQTIASTAANDHATAFSAPGQSVAGPSGMLELLEELIRRHNLAVLDLADAGNPAPNDTQILDAILDGIRAVRTIHADFSRLAP